MKVPLEWLREHVDAGKDAAAVAKLLVGAGVGVESVQKDVLDLEITTNRADLLSLLGVARELALLGRKRREEPDVELSDAGEAGAVPITVEDAVFCPRYIGRVVRGVTVGPSPEWMSRRLEAAGFRPINIIADITNFVMLECGEPLHAFDLAQLRGRKIVVRRARTGEKMTAIDGREYALTAQDGVIADGERAVAVAGVMGGRDSEIGPATHDVLLEAALFDPVSVRRTSRRLGLKSESSYRFERGIDWAAVEWASRRAAKLMVELAGGKSAPGAVDVSTGAPSPRRITLRYDRVPRVLGMKVESARIRQILEGLGCKIEKSEGVSATLVAPTTRRDLREEVDLIEEIARIEGYDRIPTDIAMPVRVVRPDASDPAREETRATLVASGAFEVLTSSFEDANAAALVSTWAAGPLIPLRNPEGFVDRTLRNSLTPALLGVLRTNEGSKEPLRPIFEIARIYRRADPARPNADSDLGADKSPFDELRVLGIAVPSGLPEARGLVERLMKRLQIPATISGGAIRAGDRVLGSISVPDLPTIGLQTRAAVVELDFNEMARRANLVRRSKVHSLQPAITRDVSMVFPEMVRWGQVESAARSKAGPLLAGMDLFDVFRDKKLGEDRKSFAFSLRFLAPDRTLAGTEVDPLVAAVKAELKAQLAGEER